MSQERIHPVSAAKLRRMCGKHQEAFRKARSRDKDENKVLPAFGHIDGLPEASAAAPPTCGKGCKTCLAQYRPLAWQKWEWLEYDCAWDDARAAEATRDAVKDTQKHLANVRDRLQRFGNAIAKRWQKKSVSKRAALLRTVMPGMHRHRWLPADLLYKLLRCESVREANFKDHHDNWLLPYLDVVSLSEDPMKLLALLHYRTKYGQAEWALWDCRQFQTPFAEGALVIAYNPHCVVMHGDRFGELVQWSEASAHSWDIVGFPLAEVTLEAQLTLSEILTTVVNTLLEDGEAPEGDDRWLALVSSGFRRHTAPRMEDMSADCKQPFAAPPCFDAEQVLEVLQARLYAAEDHLWRAQTEPEHVRQLLQKVRSSAWFQKQTDVVKEQQLVRMVTGHYTRLQRWKVVVYHARRAVFASIRHSPAVRPGRYLPEKYSHALQLLRAELETLFETLVSDLRGLATLSPTFYQHYGVDEDDNPVLRTKPEHAYCHGSLFWCIYQLHDYGEHNTLDPAFLLRCIEDSLLQSSKKGRIRIDQLLLDQLSDIASVIEVLSALTYHRPGVFTTMTDQERLTFCEAGKDWPDFAQRNTAITTTHRACSGSLYKPIGELLTVPVPTKLPTIDSVRHFDESHQLLCKMWTRLQAYMEIAYERLGTPHDKILVYRELILAPYTERYYEGLAKRRKMLELAVKKMAETNPKQSVQASQANDASLTLPPSVLVQTVWGPGAEDALETAPLKGKIKTRGRSTPTSLPLVDIQTPDDVETSESDVRIAVNSDSLELFLRMFTPSASTKKTASVEWDDLVAAFRDAGCCMVQRAGSAVAFTREESGWGSVSVHRPHPDPSINPIMLREVGKRIKKYFGWSQDTLVLRDSKKSDKAYASLD